VISSGWDPEAAAAGVVAAMLPLADPARAAQAKSYLKSDLDFLGVSVPGIRRSVVAMARAHPDLGRDDAVAWARALWDRPVHERRTAAIEAKAIGWVLRETAKHDPAYVAAWTGRHLEMMSGVTFREAVRRLPEPQAATLRDAYRHARGQS